MRHVSVAVSMSFIILAFAPAEATGHEIVEDWETGSDGWTFGPGFGVDCAIGNPGCSLRALPPCCDTVSLASRPVNVPIPPAEGGLSLEFDFKNDGLHGDTDTDVWLIFDAGQIGIHPSSGANNGIALKTHEGTFTFASYGTTGWYSVRVLISEGQVFARAYDGAGTPIGTSPTRPIPPAATRVDRIDVLAVEWNGAAAPFHFDDLRLATSDEGLPCQPVAVGLASPDRAGPAPFDAILQTSLVAPPGASCGATSWRLDFGDGSAPLTGTGDGPGDVPHTYAQAGRYVAWFNASRAGQPTSASLGFVVGTQELRESGVMLFAESYVRTRNALMQTEIALPLTSVGGEDVSLNWTAAGEAEMDLFFERAGQRYAYSACATTGGNEERCIAPEGADTLIVYGRDGVLIEWELVYVYGG